VREVELFGARIEQEALEHVRRPSIVASSCTSSSSPPAPDRVVVVARARKGRRTTSEQRKRRRREEGDAEAEEGTRWFDPDPRNATRHPTVKKQSSEGFLG